MKTLCNAALGAVLGIEPRASHMLGKYSTTDLHAQTFFQLYFEVVSLSCLVWPQICNPPASSSWEAGMRGVHCQILLQRTFIGRGRMYRKTVGKKAVCSVTSLCWAVFVIRGRGLFCVVVFWLELCNNQPSPSGARSCISLDRLLFCKLNLIVICMLPVSWR